MNAFGRCWNEDNSDPANGVSMHCASSRCGLLPRIRTEAEREINEMSENGNWMIKERYGSFCI